MVTSRAPKFELGNFSLGAGIVSSFRLEGDKDEKLFGAPNYFIEEA
jgi:hypothetical protein